jgi:hypothetical protein
MKFSAYFFNTLKYTTVICCISVLFIVLTNIAFPTFAFALGPEEARKSRGS